MIPLHTLEPGSLLKIRGKYLMFEHEKETIFENSTITVRGEVVVLVKVLTVSELWVPLVVFYKNKNYVAYEAFFDLLAQ
jgi:hypothetical protein